MFRQLLHPDQACPWIPAQDSCVPMGPGVGWVGVGRWGYVAIPQTFRWTTFQGKD